MKQAGSAEQSRYRYIHRLLYGLQTAQFGLGNTFDPAAAIDHTEGATALTHDRLAPEKERGCII